MEYACRRQGAAVGSMPSGGMGQAQQLPYNPPAGGTQPQQLPYNQRLAQGQIMSLANEAAMIRQEIDMLEAQSYVSYKDYSRSVSNRVDKGRQIAHDRERITELKARENILLQQLYDKESALAGLSRARPSDLSS